EALGDHGCPQGQDWRSVDGDGSGRHESLSLHHQPPTILPSAFSCSSPPRFPERFHKTTASRGRTALSWRTYLLPCEQELRASLPAQNARLWLAVLANFS